MVVEAAPTARATIWSETEAEAEADGGWPVRSVHCRHRLGEEGIDALVIRRCSSFNMARPTVEKVNSSFLSIDHVILMGSYEEGKENIRMPARAWVEKSIPTSAAASRS